MDDRSQEELQQGITRREVIKKAAVAGGSLVWVTPVVQAVTMQPAFAQTTSGIEDNGGNGSNGGNGGNGGSNGNEEETAVADTTATTKPGEVQAAQVEAAEDETTTADPADREVLPLTGIHADRLGPLGAGLVAGGWAAVQASKLTKPDEQGEAEDPEVAS